MGTETYQDLAEMLQLDLEARGDHWDEAPCLSFLYENDDGWQISKIDVPDHFWHPSPSAFLSFMSKSISQLYEKTEGLAQITQQVRPAEWRGVAFFSESWVVEQAKQNPDDEFDPVFTAMAEARMLHQHPAREEVRGWWAALTDGVSLIVSLKRVNGEVRSGVWEPGAGDKEKPEFTGRIPEALTTLVKTLTQP